MAPFFDYLRHPFSTHARRRVQRMKNEQAETKATEGDEQDVDEEDPGKVVPELAHLVDIGPPEPTRAMRDDRFWNSSLTQGVPPQPPGGVPKSMVGVGVAHFYEVIKEEGEDLSPEEYEQRLNEADARQVQRLINSEMSRRKGFGKEKSADHEEKVAVELEAEAANVKPWMYEGKGKGKVGEPEQRPVASMRGGSAERIHGLRRDPRANSSSIDFAPSRGKHRPPSLCLRPFSYVSRTISDLSTETPILNSNSTPHSTHFDSTTALPTDQTVYIYKNEIGERRQVAPYLSPPHSNPLITQQSLDSDLAENVPCFSDNSSPGTPGDFQLCEGCGNASSSPSPSTDRTVQPHSCTSPAFNTGELLPGWSAYRGRKSQEIRRFQALSWNGAFNMIINHPATDPVAVARIRDRARAVGITNGDGENNFISASTVSIVPNFSKTPGSAEWYDKAGLDLEQQEPPTREFLENAYRPPSPQVSDETVLSEPTEGFVAGTDAQALLDHRENWPLPDASLPNGVPASHGRPRSSSCTNATTYSDPTHNRPSGLATTPEVEEYRLQNRRSSSISLTSQLRMYEKTVATQAKLIQKLHKDIDKLYEENDDCKQYVANLEESWASCYERTCEMQKYLAGLEDENEAFAELVELMRRILRHVYERDVELDRMIRSFWQRKADRTNRALVVRVFGGSGIPFRPWVHGSPVSRRDSGQEAQVSTRSRPSSRRSVAPLLQTRTNNSTMDQEELDALMRISQQNLRLLQEDVDDWRIKVDICEDLREAREKFLKSEEQPKMAVKDV